MLKRSFRSYLFLLPLSIGLLLFSTNVWEPQPLIVPLPLAGFVETSEGVIPLLLMFFLSFILHDRYEIELSMVCGVKTTRLALGKALPVFLYTLLTTWAIILCYRYEPYTSTQYKIRIPIYVPDNFRIYLLISAFVTILFFTALFLFLRVLTRNCYIPIGIGMFLYLMLDSVGKSIRAGGASPMTCFWDPFISTYFIGDTIPNALAAKYTEDLSGLTNAWTYNRLMFFALAVLLLVATWLLLRREKLHEDFGD